MDAHAFFRILYKQRLFASFYSRLAGQASVAICAAPLEKHLLAHVPAGGKILEVGSGPGLQAIDLASRRPDLHIVASDFSEQFVRMGRENWRKLLQNKEAGPPMGSLEFVQADAMDLSVFPEASFDGVYSITAIKHFPEPARGITESWRILKPGGYLVFSEFFRGCKLEDMQNASKLFGVPQFLQPLMARIIHARIQAVTPSLEKVREWLALANIDPNSYSLDPLENFPVWILVAQK